MPPRECVGLPTNQYQWANAKNIRQVQHCRLSLLDTKALRGTAPNLSSSKRHTDTTNQLPWVFLCISHMPLHPLPVRMMCLLRFACSLTSSCSTDPALHPALTSFSKAIIQTANTDAGHFVSARHVATQQYPPPPMRQCHAAPLQVRPPGSLTPQHALS